MEKIKSLADLKKRRDDLQANMSLRENSDSPDQVVQIKVAMSTCGIASGAKPVMDALIESCRDLNVKAIVSQTGCMGYCYAEPTVEITKPGQEPIVFGYVTVEKAKDLVQKYILNNEILDGVIPQNYQSVEK